MPDDHLTLEVDGISYGGWTAVSVVRSIESIAGGFSIRATEKWPGNPVARPFRPGSRCAVRIGPDPVIAGYIDEVTISRDARSREMSCRGRDAVGDLIDCSPDVTPGEWAGLTVLEAAQRLASPFGISVRAEVPIGASFAKVTLDPGASAWDTIEELSKYRGVLPVSDGQGNLVFTRAGSARAATALIEGVNLLDEQLKLYWGDRFSHYAVKGQSQGNDHNYGDAAAGVVGRGTDPAILRHRPKVIVAGRGITTEQATQRAQWESTVRAGRSETVTVTVRGWRQNQDDTGPLWPVNAITRVRSATLGVDRELLITELEHTLDENGRKTRLTLMRPDAFALIPFPELDKGGLGFDLVVRRLLREASGPGAPP